MVTENSFKILKFFQAHPNEQYTKKDLVRILDIQMNVVTGSVRGWTGKGVLKEEVELLSPNAANPLGIRILWYQITELGRTYDPYEIDRQKVEQRLIEVAKRKEARLKEKLEQAKQILNH